MQKRRQPTLAAAQNYQNQTTANVQQQQYYPGQVNAQGFQAIPLQNILNQQPHQPAAQGVHVMPQQNMVYPSPSYSDMPPAYDVVTGGNK